MLSRKVVWGKTAFRHFEKAISFIENDSPQNSIRFKENILTKIEALVSNPEKFPADKMKAKNDGNYRCFEFHHYRISYHVSNSEIKILRVRHTSRLPKPF